MESEEVREGTDVMVLMRLMRRERGSMMRLCCI